MTANDQTHGAVRPPDDANRACREGDATPDTAAHAPAHDGHAGHDHAPDEGEPFGFDAPIRKKDPLTRGVLAIIRGYKLAVSPLMPPACRFVPTCSEYGYEAVAKYGIIKGGRLAIWRILRCNPFGRGGYDPVP